MSRNKFIVLSKELEEMSDIDLNIIWDALKDYDPAEYHSTGMSMDEWASLVYSEKSCRGL